MLIKGSARGGPVALAKHVKRTDNETVRLVRSQGVLAEDIDGALIEMDALGAALRTKRTLYHASINPQPGKDRAMTDAERDYAVGVFLKKMGFEHQPHVLIEHEKHGKDGVLRRHWHVITALTDLDHNRAIRTDHNFRKHEEAAREIERSSDTSGMRKYRARMSNASASSGRSGRRPMRSTSRPIAAASPPRRRRPLARNCGIRPDSGKALNAALEAHGWQLARGDKTRADGRAYFMAIDPQGEAHELRRMMPVKAAELYARLADVDAAHLPSVKEARTRQQVPRRRDRTAPCRRPLRRAPPATLVLEDGTAVSAGLESTSSSSI